MKKPGKREWLLLACLAAATVGVLLMLSSGGGTAKTAVDAQSYDGDTAHRIKQMVGALSGTDDAEVLVFSGTEWGDSAGTSAQSVFGIATGSNAESGGENLSGIAVAVRGGSDPHLQRELMAMIHAVFGVGTNRIYIGEKSN